MPEPQRVPMSPARGSHGYEELSNRGPKPSSRRKTWFVRGIGLVLLLGLFLATSLTLGREKNLHKILVWIDDHRITGFLIFSLLYVWFTVLFLPPALLAACAGGLYGFLVAVPLVWVCAVLGETVSFLLGRFLLRRWVRELTSDWPMWTALNAALKEDGWKLVALLRVSPVIPFSLMNYALGSSSLSFSQYFWPSVICIVPGLIIYVYLGSLAADVSEAVSGGAMSAPPAAKIAFIVTGAVSALVVMVLSAIYTKRALDRRLAHVHLHEDMVVEERRRLISSDDGTGSSRDVIISIESPVLVAESDTSINPNGIAAAALPRTSSSSHHRSSSGALAGIWNRLFRQSSTAAVDGTAAGAAELKPQGQLAVVGLLEQPVCGQDRHNMQGTISAKTATVNYHRRSGSDNVSSSRGSNGYGVGNRRVVAPTTHWHILQSNHGDGVPGLSRGQQSNSYPGTGGGGDGGLEGSLSHAAGPEGVPGCIQLQRRASEGS